MVNKQKNNLVNNPPLMLFISYVTIIVIGALVLMLPISTASGVVTPFVNTFFTSTSAFCVTGLVQYTTATYWSTFGQVVILIIIQMGGLGIMTLAGLVAFFTHKKISLKDRKIIREETNSDNLGGLFKLVMFILKSTFLIEGIGALFLSIEFIPRYGFLKGVWYSIFHAISAYCNAGFDILGEVSLSDYVGNVIVILTISSLIILGGLGFRVYKDILDKKTYKKLSLHTKIVLKMTIILLLVGTIGTMILEWNNPNTLGNQNLLTKILGGFMQSTTARTAGYYSIDQVLMTDATAFLTIILMFIGGSPAGTAGGLKTTTFATLIASVNGELKNKEDVVILNKRIPRKVAKKAVAIVVVFLGWTLMATFLLIISEPNLSALNLNYEVVSAIATVGLTRGVSPNLSMFGKYLIAFTMIFGKVGPLSMLYAFSSKPKAVNYKEAEEPIIIG